ncbi:MAG: hypothetical protein M5U12_27180 [Verrucomicrobia bacterium]|nr:hypothetical protein [Verrucomicrobiota bacterium]
MARDEFVPGHRQVAEDEIPFGKARDHQGLEVAGMLEAIGQGVAQDGDVIARPQFELRWGGCFEQRAARFQAERKGDCQPGRGRGPASPGASESRRIGRVKRVRVQAACPHAAFGYLVSGCHGHGGRGARRKEAGGEGPVRR